MQARVDIIVHEQVAEGGPGQQPARPRNQKGGESPEQAGLLPEVAVKKEEVNFWTSLLLE